MTQGRWKNKVGNRMQHTTELIADNDKTMNVPTSEGRKCERLMIKWPLPRGFRWLLHHPIRHRGRHQG